MEEDPLYHLSIADAGKNSVLKSLMMIITPDIISSYVKYRVCDDLTEPKTHYEHEEILRHIRNQDSVAVKGARRRHLDDVARYSQAMRKA